MTLERLFEANHASLFRFVTRLTNDPELAKDIVQDTFLHLVDRRPAEMPPPAWLFQIARNLARSKLRRRGRRLRLLRRGGAPAIVPDAPHLPDADVEREESRAAIHAALAELTEKERTILLMRHEGFAHRDIAKAVGTTTGSVGTMYARALRKLEARFDGRGEDAR